MVIEPFDLALSFLFTWLIGLGLPALVRFILYRRALLAAEALTWACILGLGEMAIFIALGSQNKTHAVLFLIGWLAYRLMQRPNGRFDARIRTELASSASNEPEGGNALCLPRSVRPSFIKRAAKALAIRGKGQRRLILTLSTLAFVSLSLASVWQHFRHTELIAIAKEVANLREDRRTRLVNQYVEDTRQKFASLPKIGGTPIAMDERLVRERGHKLVSEDEQQIRTGAEMRDTYGEAYDSLERRNQFAVAAIGIPIFLYFIFLVGRWVVAGFQDNALRPSRDDA